MTQKRNCERCRALCLRQGFLPECQLGYKLDAVKIIPLEPCEKPLTYEAYFNALNDYKERKRYATQRQFS